MIRSLARLTLALAALFTLTLAPGCDKKAADKPPAADKATAKAAAKAAAPKVVEVPKDGKKFDPPVQKDQIPAGAWYCDMGTVHYARMDKGDGKCPVCHMMLTQKK